MLILNWTVFIKCQLATLLKEQQHRTTSTMPKEHISGTNQRRVLWRHTHTVFIKMNIPPQTHTHHILYMSLVCVCPHMRYICVYVWIYVFAFCDIENQVKPRATPIANTHARITSCLHSTAKLINQNIYFPQPRGRPQIEMGICNLAHKNYTLPH